MEMNTSVKCKQCGQNIQVSRDGWTIETFQNGKREIRYVEWIHVIGHYHQNGKMCRGSGASPIKK